MSRVCSICHGPLRRRGPGTAHRACRVWSDNLPANRAARLAAQRGRVRTAIAQLRERRVAEGLCRECGRKLWVRNDPFSGRRFTRCVRCREQHRQRYARRRSEVAA